MCDTQGPPGHSLWRSGPGGSGWRARSWQPETGVGIDALLSAGLATRCHTSGTKAPCAEEVLSGHPRMNIAQMQEGSERSLSTDLRAT